MIDFVKNNPVAAMSLTTIVGVAIGYIVNVLVCRMQEAKGQRKAEQLVADAQDKADQLVRDARVRAKDESYAMREEVEKEAQEVRKELRDLERRLTRREDNLDRKGDVLNKKERYVENLERTLASKRKEIDSREEDLARLLERQEATLERISGMSHDEAVEMLMKRLEHSLDRECAELVSREIKKAEEDADIKARHILTSAIQRCAADHTAEALVSTIQLPSDEMKGRIIGREGRNIRAFEKATGIDVIVDDTPGVIVVSGFDSVRRELARRSMEKLVQDGRIHPSRIEDIVHETEREIDASIKEAGKATCMDVGVHGLDPKLVELIGRLQFRTSYGQNQLNHATEVANLAGLIAAELRLDQKLAKRCGLLHDIGKAIDHQIEGSHAQIGADMAKRYDESPIVLNAIAAHHEECDAESPYAVLVSVADTISAGRPGARRETLEKYIKRLERLESIATSFGGVYRAFAIQAGREVRVIVNSEKVNDKGAVKVARDIAKEIEEELNYPGEITVTVLRETRVVEKAK